MKILIKILLFLNMLIIAAYSQNNITTEYHIDPQLGFSTGPNINEKVPEFNLPDQDGIVKSLTEMVGENGALLIFYRSASW
jgi:hypothetical protein